MSRFLFSEQTMDNLNIQIRLFRPIGSHQHGASQIHNVIELHNITKICSTMTSILVPVLKILVTTTTSSWSLSSPLHMYIVHTYKNYLLDPQHKHTHTCIHIHSASYPHTDIHICLCIYTYVRIYVYAYTYMSVYCIHAYSKQTCMYTCT